MARRLEVHHDRPGADDPAHRVHLRSASLEQRHRRPALAVHSAAVRGPHRHRGPDREQQRGGYRERRPAREAWRLLRVRELLRHSRGERLEGDVAGEARPLVGQLPQDGLAARATVDVLLGAVPILMLGLLLTLSACLLGTIRKVRGSRS